MHVPTAETSVDSERPDLSIVILTIMFHLLHGNRMPDAGNCSTFAYSHRCSGRYSKLTPRDNPHAVISSTELPGGTEALSAASQEAFRAASSGSGPPHAVSIGATEKASAIKRLLWRITPND